MTPGQLLQHLLYLVSWGSLVLCVLGLNPAPYLLVTSAQTLTAVQAPLGQCLPVLDVTTNFFHVHSLLLSAGFLVLGVWSLRNTHMESSGVVEIVFLEDSWGWIGCSVLLGIRSCLSWNICDKLKNDFRSIPAFPVDWFDRSASTTNKMYQSSSSSRSSQGNGLGSSLVRLPFYARLHPFFLYWTPKNLTKLSGSVNIFEIVVEAEVNTDINSFEDKKCELDDGSLDSSSCLFPLSPSSSSSTCNQFLIDIWTTEKGEMEAEPGTKPVFLFFHGGGWLGGGKRFHSSVSLLHNLAARGWLVVSVGYRKKWPYHIEDAVEAFQWVCQQGHLKWGADRARIYLSGGSAGGHIATLLSLRMLQTQHNNASKDADPAWKICGIVLFYPAVDVVDETKSTAVFPFACGTCEMNRNQSLLLWYFEHMVMRLPSSCNKQVALDDANPLEQLRRFRESKNGTTMEECDYPPTLIIHGELDSIVPLKHSQHWLECLYHCSTYRDQWSSKTATPRSKFQKNIRSTDALISIPGAKHSYEIASSSMVDCTVRGVLGWLIMRNDWDG